MQKYLFSFVLLMSGSTLLAAPHSIKKYSLPKNPEAIEIGLWPQDLHEFDFTLNYDLVDSKLKAKLIEYTDDTGETVSKQCEFTEKIAVDDIAKIKKLASKVVYCKQKGDEEVVTDYAYLDYFDYYIKRPSSPNSNDAKLISLEKYFVDGGGTHRYFCKGQQALYKHLKKIAGNLVPGECPRSYKEVFELE